MSEFDEDGIDRCRRLGDLLVSTVENAWNELLSRGPTEEELLDSIAGVNEALREPVLGSHKRTLEQFRKAMAVRLVAMRHGQVA